MNLENQQKAQIRSIVSSIIAAANSINGAEMSVADQDLREQVEDKLMDLIDSLEKDLTSWPYVKEKYFYDVYLQMRKDTGSLTKTDEIRPGLSSVNFTESAEWHRHQLRIAEHKTTSTAGEVKECSICHLTLPKSKFRKTGSVCNSCRGKQYRERKAEEALK